METSDPMEALMPTSTNQNAGSRSAISEDSNSTSSSPSTPGTSEAVTLAPVSSPVSAMPAPKIQAPPPRSRRMPTVVDSSNLIPARRSSTRSIKRKKFDDELVESSLVKTERGSGRVKGGGGGISTSSASSSSSSAVSGGHVTQVHGQATLAPTPSTLNSVPTLTQSPSIGCGGGVDVGTIAPMSGTPLISAVPSLSVSAQSQTPLSSSTSSGISTSSRAVKEVKELVKHVESSTSVKPPAEKRSKPSSGKSGGHGKTASSSKSHSSGSRGGAGVAGGKSAASSNAKSNVMRPSGSSKSKSKSKRSRKQKPGLPNLKDLGRWKPQDDLALITAVQQTNDLRSVHLGVKFSCRFTLKEIEERWYSLLYDQSISKIAMEAARQLHSETVATIQGKALYSVAEENLLGTCASSSQPTLESFQSLLQQHPDVFHPARTPKTLQCHWLLMKQFHLLPDQTVQPMPKGDHILNLSDIEDFMNDEDIKEGKDVAIEQELTQVDRRNKREIRHLEQEMPKWQVLVDSVTGISMPDFDNQTLGVLRGRLVRYLMRSREISLGRATKDNHVDVDLSLEGPAWKVSRRQGVIKLRNSGDFFIANEGKRPIMVDGKPVLAGSKQKLNNNSVVEISCLRFTFLINVDVINAIRADGNKPSTSHTAPHPSTT